MLLFSRSGRSQLFRRLFFEFSAFDAVGLIIYKQKARNPHLHACVFGCNPRHTSSMSCCICNGPASRLSAALAPVCPACIDRCAIGNGECVSHINFCCCALILNQGLRAAPRIQNITVSCTRLRFLLTDFRAPRRRFPALELNLLLRRSEGNTSA